MRCCSSTLHIFSQPSQERTELRTRILVCAVFVLIASFFATAVLAENIDLFVLAGQSNMQGWKGNSKKYPADPNGIDRKVRFYWVTPTLSSSGGKWTSMQPQGGLFSGGHFGPEVTFARLLVNDGCNPAIFKYSLGSTGLALTWKGPGQNGMYDEMVAELRKAVSLLKAEGHRVNFRALVWVQGESDAEYAELADGYEERLKTLINDFRTKVSNDNLLPVILGIDEQHPCVKEFPRVLEAQQKLAREGQNIAFTSMIGLEKADGTHLTPKGLEEHGKRLFAAYKTLNRTGNINCSPE